MAKLKMRLSSYKIQLPETHNALPWMIGIVGNKDSGLMWEMMAEHQGNALKEGSSKEKYACLANVFGLLNPSPKEKTRLIRDGTKEFG